MTFLNLPIGSESVAGNYVCLRYSVKKISTYVVRKSRLNSPGVGSGEGDGSMVQWFNGSMVQWFNVSMVQWFNGSMIQ